MKAAMFKGPFKVEYEEMPAPQIADDQVLIQLKACGICGSDLHGFEGQSGKRRVPGLIMGHEGAGEVVEVGKNASGVKVGDRVTIDPQNPCGQCYYCRRGWRNLCDQITGLGSAMRGFKHGLMCEYAALDPRQLIPLPDRVSYHEGTFLDPISNVSHVLDKSPVHIGDTLAIIGSGVMGLIAVQLARYKGFSKIIAIDRVESRLERAKAFGADVVVDSGLEDCVERVKQETDGLGADVVMEAAGLAATYQYAVEAVRKRGTVLAFGFRDAEIPISSQAFLFRELTMIGNGGFAFETAKAMGLIASGWVDVKSLITDCFPLHKAQEGFMTLHENPETSIKVLLTM